MTTGLGDVVQQFDLAQYVPADLQNDYNTGVSYYNAFKTGVQNVSFQGNGSIQLSDQAANAIGDAVLYAFEASIPVVGQALAVFMAVAPSAGPGPGTCISQPPAVADRAHPKPSEIQGWQNYTSWSKLNGSYDVGDPSSFEAYANTALQWNWELGANCFLNLQAPSPVLLAALVASWNATHAGPQRTVTRSGLNPSSAWGLPPGYDPIAEALTENLFGNASLAGQIPANNITGAFTINDGPEIASPNGSNAIGPVGPAVGPRTIHLRLSAASAPMSTGSKVALSAAIVAGSAAAGVGVWAFLTHQAYGEAWGRLWKKSGGRLLKG